MEIPAVLLVLFGVLGLAMFVLPLIYPRLSSLWVGSAILAFAFAEIYAVLSIWWIAAILFILGVFSFVLLIKTRSRA